MAKITKTDWLRAGLCIVSERGFNELTLKNLLSYLNVTHGSFYHHFKNRQQYTLVLLEYWRDGVCAELATNTVYMSDPSASTEVLVNIARLFQRRKSLEIALRSEAHRNAEVSHFVEEVDCLRLTAARKLATLRHNDDEKGRIIGTLVHAMFIGIQQTFPPLSEAEITEIFIQVHSMKVA